MCFMKSTVDNCFRGLTRERNWHMPCCIAGWQFLLKASLLVKTSDLLQGGAHWPLGASNTSSRTFSTHITFMKHA
jgi:hypothetical protein